MYDINVNKKYNIYIEENFDNLKIFLDKDKIKYNNIFVLTDENVYKHYLEQILDIFKDKNVYNMCIKAGEKSKNLNTVFEIYKQMLDSYIDRKSLFIALGGGVVGDIGGFVASTYMRGINFIQIPTTLLSQVDSSVGGKTGVDFFNKKNMIGSFYNPSLVYISLNVLDTLPKIQFENGMAEIIKHGYILDKEYLEYIKENKEKIMQKDSNILSNIIKKSCEIKAKIVSLDEKEQGIREILNFGHTFGHAIETQTNFEIMHGKAISIGMIASLYISYKKGYISLDILQEAKELFRYFNLYEKLNLDVKDLYKNMMYDKKNENKKIKLIILKDLENAIATNKIEDSEILDAITYALEG